MRGRHGVDVAVTSTLCPMKQPTVLVVAFNGKCFGIDAVTGESLWRRELHGGTVVLRVREGRVYALCSGLVCLDLASGEVLWSVPTVGIQWTAMVVDAGSVVLGGQGEACAFDAVSGERRWHERFKGDGRGPVSLATERDHSQAERH